MIRVGTFDESLPLLKLLWPDSFHIFPIDNSFGLVTWTPTELKNARPTFFVIEEDSEVVASLHLFYADKDTLCLRGIVSDCIITTDQWSALFDYGLRQMNHYPFKKVYTVSNDSINTLITALGFTEMQGPFWTDDWKVFVSWKQIDD
jgi:N-acetylglutamate synthase-like GNAT family acetyltransferase